MSYGRDFGLVKHGNLLVASLKIVLLVRKSTVHLQLSTHSWFKYPSTRVAFAAAFTHTGVDYAGPVFVKNIYDSQKMYKAWIFIFTCASSRAKCLELVPSCDAGKCRNALRRFFSRYGVPETILFDNSTQFSSQETQSFISSYGLKWHFNPPLSLWWGGIFERMVRSIKRCLKKILLGVRTTY